MTNNNEPSKLSSAYTTPLILSFCAVSFLMIYLVITQNIEIGSATGGWVYPYFKSVRPIALWPALLVISLIGVMIYRGSRLIVKYEKMTLLVCYIGAILAQALLQRVYPYSMSEIIQSGVANSFYTTAMQYTPAEYLSQYLAIVPTREHHERSNMPGKVLFFHLLSAITPSTGRMGYLVIAASTLGALLLYWICKQLFQDQLLAFYAFLLYILIPSKQVFLPILNTVTPLFILLSLALFLAYLNSKKVWYLICLGISLYLMFFFDPSPLVTGTIFIGAMLHSIGQKTISPKDLLTIAIVTVLAFSATYLFFLIFFSFDLWRAFQFILNDAIQFNLEGQHSYELWAKENIKEFFYAAGLPACMIFVYYALHQISQWKTYAKNILHWSNENLYFVSLLITFSAVMLLGINRGEITRLWIYLAVLLQVPVAIFMAKTVKNNTLFFAVAITLIVESLVMLQSVGFVVP